MYDSTITLFNFHEKSGKWFSTIISKADLLVNKSSSSTSGGINGEDSIEIIVKCTPAKAVNGKDYLPPKQYAKCDDPQNYFTFRPESDFIYDGEWSSSQEILDDDYDEGFYHAMNDEYDGVYMITSAAFFSLLPHFEIGGR